MTSDPDLSRFFHPRRIAVVGASATPNKIGAMPVTLLRRHGYSGRIIPVNPRGGVIQELPVCRELAALDEPVDLAVLAVPAELAAQAL
ncbi:CoA-binding protein, partial [Bordetella petrii]|uniref:CoA-binding protein n=1 Tax=Bordetella petrii TaxID=94624 RepID=UPI001E303E64